MPHRRPKVALAFDQRVLDQIDDGSMARLQAMAEVRQRLFSLPSSWDQPPPVIAGETKRLIELAAGAAAVVVGPGAPRVSATVMEACPTLRFIGELEGDRFAQRIDLESAWQRDIRTIDTTNGTSYGVAEWALSLSLIGLRNAGAHFRRMIVDRTEGFAPAFFGDRGFRKGELSGSTVGLIGCGIIGRRLLELLEPFGCHTYVHDPYAPRELADVYGFTFTDLDHLLRLSEVVFCLLPITPATRSLIGARELALLPDEAVLVNVGRGAVIDTDALIAELQSGRIGASLDVFDPEPIPAASPIRDLPNVFLTPHIAGETLASRQRLFSIMVDELERFFAGHETRYDITASTVANRSGGNPPVHR
jgi:phosphoglycerate dehydrogenase-like enzyme